MDPGFFGTFDGMWSAESPAPSLDDIIPLESPSPYDSYEAHHSSFTNMDFTELTDSSPGYSWWSDDVGLGGHFLSSRVLPPMTSPIETTLSLVKTEPMEQEDGDSSSHFEPELQEQRKEEEEGVLCTIKFEPYPVASNKQNGKGGKVRKARSKVNATCLPKGKKPLYSLTREDCATEEDWKKVQRAQNTKRFHETQKSKIVVGRDLLAFCMEIQGVREALSKEVDLVKRGKFFFPDIFYE